MIFLKRSLVFPNLFFSSISLYWLLRKAFLSLPAILWNSAFRWEYLSFSPLLNFYWSIIALQCVLLCTAQQNELATHISPLLESLPLQVTTEHWVEFCVLYSRFSFVIYFIRHINSYVSIPITKNMIYLGANCDQTWLCTLCQFLWLTSVLGIWKWLLNIFFSLLKMKRTVNYNHLQ